MVQSIWLYFDKSDLNDNTIEKIKRTIAENWHVTCFKDKDSILKNTEKIEIWDTNFPIRTLGKIMSIGNNVCDCGCFSTMIARILKFTLDLEFNHGKIDDVTSFDYYRLGRDIWGSVGYDIFYQRLFLLHRILKKIQKQLKEAGIKSKLSLSDVNDECLLVKNFKNGELKRRQNQ